MSAGCAIGGVGAGGRHGAGESGACPKCRRRSWLLGELSPVLDYHARDRARLLELLALSDMELIDALGGRRAAQLRADHERFGRGQAGAGCAGQPGQRPVGGAGGESAPRALADESGRGWQSICRHDPRYPSALTGPLAPPMLELAGAAQRLSRLADAPTVAVMGSAKPSDYGVQMARSLARGLRVAGVTVLARLAGGISAAAVEGALEVDGGCVAVAGDGLGAAGVARVRLLRKGLQGGGCVVSELQDACSGRRWAAPASERIVVALARVCVLVEAMDRPGELGGARIALEHGRIVAAVPGRVTSPLAGGPHALLREGANLVCGAGDVLELLYAAAGAEAGGAAHASAGGGRAGAEAVGNADTSAGGESLPARMGARDGGGLRADLRSLLEQIGAGRDTPDRLEGEGASTWELLGRLSELELLGLVSRGRGGRYVPREPLDGAGRRAQAPNRRPNP